MLRSQRQPSRCLLSSRASLLPKTQIFLYSCCTIVVSEYSDLYFRYDKVKSNVYNIKVLKLVLGEAVSKDLLFLQALFNADQKDSLASIRYIMLCKKVARAKTYLITLMAHDDIELSEWGWKVERNKLVTVMTDKSPAADVFIQMIHCNCSEGCNAVRCTCRKHGLECTSACGHCQDGNFDNMRNDSVLEDDDEDV